MTMAASDGATWRQAKRRVLAALAASYFVSACFIGPRDLDSRTASVLFTVMGVATSVAAVFWCTWDGHERRTGRGAPVWAIVLFTVVGVPVHLLRTRGIWRGLASTLVAAAYFLGLSILCALAILLHRAVME